MKALLWLLILSLAPFSLGQDDPAERLFFNAQTFMTAGKYEEALTDLENVVKIHPRSPYASQALLEIGRYYLEVAGDDERAQSDFSRILKDYPGSPEAPAAYYYQAVIVDKNGKAPQALESAVADLIRMENLFPNNNWRNGALYLFGKLSMRLGQYDQSLTYFQRLEFNYPQSNFLPSALLLGAKVAYYNGHSDQAIRTLARLQAKFPNSLEARTAASLLRALDRIQSGTVTYTLDRGFFASRPKSFKDPSSIGLGWNGVIAIKDGRGVVEADLNGGNLKRAQVRDVEGFCRDRNGTLVWVFENRLGGAGGEIRFSNLPGAGGTVREIRAAAIDGYNRLYVLDGNSRDVRSFSADGKPLKNFAIAKPKLVRAFEETVWVLNSNSDSFSQINAAQQVEAFRLSGVTDIVDFCFDALGHVFVLHDRGNQISLFDRDAKLRYRQNLRASNWPFKNAEAIGMDAAGSLYLADKKTGAVYRFK